MATPTGPRPQDLALSRDRLIAPARTALLLVDVQNHTFGPDVATTEPYFHERVTRTVLPNLARLIVAGRRHGVEVMYTVIENLTADGRDRSLDYKLSGFFIEKGSWDAQVLDAVAPGADEIVLPKTSSSLFNSTNFDYLLRNMGIEFLAVTGFLTDQCVDQTVRDAADRGYYALCVADACATYSAERHASALSLFGGYCRTLDTDTLIAELGAGGGD